MNNTHLKHFLISILVSIGKYNVIYCEEFSEELIQWDGNSDLSDDDLPYSDLTQLSELEKNTVFKVRKKDIEILNIKCLRS